MGDHQGSGVIVVYHILLSPARWLILRPSLGCMFHQNRLFGTGKLVLVQNARPKQLRLPLTPCVRQRSTSSLSAAANNSLLPRGGTSRGGAGGDHGIATMWNRREISASSYDDRSHIISPRPRRGGLDRAEEAVPALPGRPPAGSPRCHPAVVLPEPPAAAAAACRHAAPPPPTTTPTTTTMTAPRPAAAAWCGHPPPPVPPAVPGRWAPARAPAPAHTPRGARRRQSPV
jgi:hypothetical protein